MPIHHLAIFLSLLLVSTAGATTNFPVSNTQQEASEIACPEGFLEGYTCRNQPTLDDIVKIHQEAITLIHTRRAAEKLQDLPMPSDTAGLFSYLRWHRELYGLDDIDPGNLPRPGSETEIKENGQDEDRGSAETGGVASSPNAEEGMEVVEEPRTAGRDDKGSGDEGGSRKKEWKRMPIPGLPPNEVADDAEPNEGLHSEGFPRRVPPSEKPSGEVKNGQSKDTDSTGMGDATPRTSPPNVENSMEGDEKHRTVEEHGMGPGDGGIQPPGSDREGSEPTETDDSGARSEKLWGHPVNPESREYRHIKACLRDGRCPDEAVSSVDEQVPNRETVPQAMEIYRIDSCVIGQDRGESDMPADNVTVCGPSGRLLAGFKPGRYKIRKDNFLHPYQTLFDGLERSLEGYKLSGNWTVLILGYADDIPYKSSYGPPPIDKHKGCSFRGGKLRFNEVAATGDGRTADHDGNRQLALARAREIQNWLGRKGVLKSDKVCLMASSTRPKIDSVPDGEPLDRAVAVYVISNQD
uniref:OmpA family protein n=1 Tax=Candidatus Kentrum sp. FM TaxID=2126340 RepID=A0A450RY79_9GAMM|nr:MAG: hypothetical protein BECKFM1743A_GA0114220_100148 [Candidatus Kentron sp. FM]VFJ44527.1 MAG: hypothetical protein BECKFM1743C_GA0114222_1001210 [Candidatus Kentron sp. FM]VFK05988.1 MAG: hypothetical protein BECKFM1743B_GA0114221_1000814 [Candidatus Kentron sp. FM]